MGAALDRAPRVAMERVRDEWIKLLRASAPSAGIEPLRRSGLLALWMPELDACAGVTQNRYHAYDVYEHSLRVCDAAPAHKPRVRWAALLHDIGKVKTRSISPAGEVHFFGHAEVGARMFDKIDRRVPLFTKDAAFKSSVRFLILNHLRASQYDGSWTDSAVRRFAKEMGEGMEEEGLGDLLSGEELEMNWMLVMGLEQTSSLRMMEWDKGQPGKSLL